MKAYKKVLTFNPQNSTVLSHLGQIYEVLEDTDRAKGYAEQALRIDPTNLIAKRIMEKWKNYNSKSKIHSHK